MVGSDVVDALASVLVFPLPGVVFASSGVVVLISVETDPEPSFHKTKCHPLRSANSGQAL